MKLFAKYWLTNRDPVPTVMRINQSQIFNKTFIVLFLARIHLNILDCFQKRSWELQRGQVYRVLLLHHLRHLALLPAHLVWVRHQGVFKYFFSFFPSKFSLTGDRHLHLSLALRLRHPGSPLSAQALHHSVPASQKRSKLLHNSIEKCEDVNFYFNLQGARWSLLSVSLKPPRAEAISAMRLLPMANFKSLSLNLFPGEMPHWAWTEHKQ